MPGKTSSKDRVTTDARPFGFPWLDSCYQETLLPSGPWHKVHTTLCDALAARIGKQFTHPERKQMIFELMGIDFVRKYFPDEPYNPLIIEPPQMSAEARTRLQLDAQNWLQNALSRVCAETGCVRPVADDTGARMSEDTKEFLRHTKFLFNKGMNRQLHLQEKEIEDKWEKAQYDKEKAKEMTQASSERKRLQREHERLYGGVSGPALRGILKPATRMSTGVSTAASQRTHTANVKGAVFGTSEDPPVFTGMQSNSLGRSLAAILKRDPRRSTEVAVKLHGRQLPASLRTYLWIDLLLKHEREKLNDVHTETIVRERFGKTIARNVSELKIKRATHCPISALIENAVIEMFDKTPAMRPYMDDSVFMKEAAKALNVLYVYDRSYEPYLIHWLFPLQYCFQDSCGEDEHVYELAMYLDLLNKGLFPKWPEIFASAETVMSRLREADLELHDHLKHISQQDAKYNPKDFLVQLIHQEKSEAEALLKLTPGSDQSKAMSKQLLADPVIFLRKWIGEGFVGVLDTQAAVFVWDQCFLQKWHLQVLEDTCLAILLLLKHKFMAANSYQDMKHVFLKEPSLIYTMDIQRAWVHIQRSAEFPQVPYMNRLRPKTPDNTFSSPAARRSPTPSVSSSAPLEPLGIKNLRLTLHIPVESLHRESWLSSLDMRCLQLDCQIYFGSVKMAEKSTQHVPVIVGEVEKDKYGALTYRIHYTKDKLIFESLDVGKYDLEMEMGGVPFAIVQVKYKAPSVSEPIPLGWARVKLYQHKSELNDKHWTLLDGDYYYTVYAGPPQDQFNLDPNQVKSPKHSAPVDSDSVSIASSVQSDPQGGVDIYERRLNTPFLQRFGELLGNNCQLGAFVYDPRGDAAPPPPVKHSPVQTPPPPKKKTPVPRAQPPKQLGVEDTFDLYIDSVCNIPDNATITKVTGRLVKTGDVTDVQDLLALPQLNSSARNPQYKYKIQINKDKLRCEKDMVMLLRIYTVDLDTRELVVIGSCLFEIFDTKQKVKVGSHCRQIHSGMPDLKQGLQGIHQKALDSAPRIPGCKLYFRVTSHSNEYIDPPSHDAYQSHDPNLNASEVKIVRSYRGDDRFPRTTREAAKTLQEVDGDTQGEITTGWLRDRLDNKKHLPPNQPADNLDIHRLVRYRLNIGFSISVVQAYGLPEGYYIQCFARVASGKKAQEMRTTEEGYGKDEKTITLKHDWESRQKAPVWEDIPKKWHPHLDDHSVIIVQVFGLEPVYKPSANHKSPGSVKRKDGKALTLGEEELLGWGVVPLFEKDYVLNGRHHVPIFKNKPDDSLLNELTEELPEDVIARQKWTKANKYDGAALVVDIWDSHYDKEHIPGGLVRTDFLLDVLDTKEPYVKAEADQSGKKMTDLFAKYLDKKDQKPNSEVYKKEKELYQKVMSEVYYDLMESALMNAGYGPS